MQKLSLYILLIVTTFISCSKDDDTQKEEPDNNKDLLIGKWYVTSIIIDGAALDEGDCELYSTLDINVNGAYEEQTYGGFTGGDCSPDDLDKGTWKLSDKVLSLTLDELGNATSLTTANTILELTEKTLKYQFEDSRSDGSKYTEIWTFGKTPTIPPIATTPSQI